MKKTRRSPLLTKILIPAVALFGFVQCSQEAEDIMPQQTSAETVQTQTQKEQVVSLTVDGLYTEFASITECKTCDYIVPVNATRVDGQELGIKPGQTVCLDAKLKYGNLELVNMIGEEQKPIKIAYSVVFAKDSGESAVED